MKNRILNITAIVAVAFALSGCSNMNTTQQRVLSGTGIGAGVGLVGTAMTGGCVSCGAAIGAGAGAAAGYIYDQSEKRHGN
jgi:osmotically inducible lipoprotein OsmB